MDQYLADKEAREAASAAQAVADAIPSQQFPLGIKMPTTVEKTRQAIDDTLQDINDEKGAIDRLNEELASAPDEQKTGIQRELDRHTTGVQTSQQELKAFQDHLKRWTNDELESSRTPMDQYLADKKAREAASAAQAAADAIPSQQVPLGIKMPATVEKTRQRIDDTLQDIKDQKDAIDRLNKELESAPEEQKAGIQRQLDRHTTGVQTSQQELKAFQDHLKRLNSKSPGEDSADSGKLPFE
jgi:uncharacterized protein YicC (UPF0701 family)